MKTKQIHRVGAALLLGVAATVLACGSSGGDGACNTGPTGASICIEKTSFGAGESITVHFAGGPGTAKDWIAVYPAGCCSPSCPGGSTLWEYGATDSHNAPPAGVTNGSVVIDALGNSSNWPLTPGSWEMLYLADDGYDPLARIGFEIEGDPVSAPCGHSGSSSSGCSSDGDCSSSCSNDCYQCLGGSCSCGSEDDYGVCTY
jgi:hypothetical protein